ncbi:MAG: ATP synthase subunit I [Clostridium sp.]|nr:ATP synthase subunit I [Clostridium sp.]
MQIQPAVKKETTRIASGTAILTILMFAGFIFLHHPLPERGLFDYKVILSGILGSIIATGNFFLMGLTVQKVTFSETKDAAYKAMKSSYRFRTATQLLWAILALALPCFNGAAGILPLFFPSLCIKAGHVLDILRT